MEEEEFEYLRKIVDEYILDSNNELRQDILLFTDDFSTVDTQSVQNSISSIGFDLPNIVGLAQFAAIKFLYAKEIAKKEKEDFEFIFHNDFNMWYKTIRSFMFVIAQVTAKFLLSKSSTNSVSNLLRVLLNNLDGYLLNSLDLRSDIITLKTNNLFEKNGISYLEYNKDCTVVFGENNIVSIQKIINRVSSKTNVSHYLTEHDNELSNIFKDMLVSTISYLFNLTRSHGYTMVFCKYCKEINLYTSTPATATETDASKCCPECYIHYERKDEWKHLDTLEIFRKHTT